MAWYDFNETEVAKPTMADLRKAAEAEYSDGSRYGIRPEGYEKYGDMDWLGGRDTRPTWTEADQLRINQIEAEQQMYNQNKGTTYSGGPLSGAIPSNLEAGRTPLFGTGGFVKGVKTLGDEYERAIFGTRGFGKTMEELPGEMNRYLFGAGRPSSERDGGVQVSPFRGDTSPTGPLSAGLISSALNERRKREEAAALITKVNLRF
jgi:hypothetical protein